MEYMHTPNWWWIICIWFFVCFPKPHESFRNFQALELQNRNSQLFWFLCVFVRMRFSVVLKTHETLSVFDLQHKLNANIRDAENSKYSVIRWMNTFHVFELHIAHCIWPKLFVCAVCCVWNGNKWDFALKMKCRNGYVIQQICTSCPAWNGSRAYVKVGLTTMSWSYGCCQTCYQQHTASSPGFQIRLSNAKYIFVHVIHIILQHTNTAHRQRFIYIVLYFIIQFPSESDVWKAMAMSNMSTENGTICWHKFYAWLLCVCVRVARSKPGNRPFNTERNAQPMIDPGTNCWTFFFLFYSLLLLHSHQAFTPRIHVIILKYTFYIFRLLLFHLHIKRAATMPS